MKITVIVPAYKEDPLVLQRCLFSLTIAKISCPCKVEVHVVKDVKGVGRAKNTGARNTTGDILVFIDSDCTVSRTFLKNVYDVASVEENMGGGTKWVKLDKYSLGRILFLLPIAIWLYWHQVTTGAMWIRREVFDKIDGYSENDSPDLDFDFSLRLKKYTKETKTQFRSLKHSYIVWSTRSWDKYGQWFWITKYRMFQEN